MNMKLLPKLVMYALAYQRYGFQALTWNAYMDPYLGPVVRP